MKKLIFILFIFISIFVFGNEEIKLKEYLDEEILIQETSDIIYRDILRFSRKHSVDPLLIAVIIKVESNFKQEVLSNKGAIGLMQLMPETADELGVNPFDITSNLEGGIKHFSWLLKKYNGSLGLSLAAYNAGSGNLSKYDGIPPFEETQKYVLKILKIYRAKFGKEYRFNSMDFPKKGFDF